MARSQRRQEEPEAPEEAVEATEGDTAEEATEGVAPEPGMTDEEAAALLVAKTEAGESKVWGPLKKSTEIPERMAGNEFAILQAKRGDTPAETWENILVFSGGSDVAALDCFNATSRLGNQKALKAAMVGHGADATPLTVAEIQELSNRHTVAANTRGRGGKGSAKVRAARAEAKVAVAQQSMAEMVAALAEHDPEAAAKFEERLAALGQ